MDLNSRLFDRIRVKPTRKPAEPAPATPCSYPGCKADGVFRAPKGRDRENEYFCFCMDHVREYNATYDYFRGMDDEAFAKFRQAETIGHRPTWKMGPRGGAQERSTSTRPSTRRRVHAPARRPANRRRRAGASLQRARAKGAVQLELSNETEITIKARYKELVKRHHHDANGGDRSSEDKLREIIQAYNYLRVNKLV